MSCDEQSGVEHNCSASLRVSSLFTVPLHATAGLVSELSVFQWRLSLLQICSEDAECLKRGTQGPF